MDEDDVARLDYEARDVWLVKVPQRVAQAWDKLTEEDVQLGKVRIHHAAEGEKNRAEQLALQSCSGANREH